MVYLRINQKLREELASAEASTSLRIVSLIDKAGCLQYADFKAFVQSLPESGQLKFAGLVKFDDIVMDVQHANEMKVLNESEETKKMRERLKLKKEKRELYKITGRKMESEIPGDQTLKTFESSMKFAMSYLFALFTSGLGGYFAAKVFFGFDYAASLLVAGILMFLTIMIEVSLYITKTLKSDLITQKAQKIKKATEQRKFDEYYYRTKGGAGQNTNSTDPVKETAQMSTETDGAAKSEFESRERNQKKSTVTEADGTFSSSKKDK